jgi:hypothetical protein
LIDVGEWPAELVDRCVIAVHREVVRRHGDVVRPIVQSWGLAMPGIVIDLAEFIVADALTDDVVRGRYPFLPTDVIAASLDRRPPDDLLMPQLQSILRTRAATADELWGSSCDEVAAALVGASAALTASSQPLAVAYRSLPSPDGAAARVHHLLTGLRYERLAAHVAACDAAGLRGADSVVLTKVWSGEPLDDRPTRLVDEGLVDASGAITDAGRSARDRIEAETDAACIPMWRAIEDPMAWRLALERLAAA